MASFSVPAPSTSAFSFTLGQLKDRIRRAVSRDNVVEMNNFWKEPVVRQAIESGLDWCRPVGVKMELTATAGTAGFAAESLIDTDRWEVLARLTRLDSIQIKGSFQGFDIQQDVPVKSVQQSTATDGTAVLTFNYPIGIGSIVDVTGLWQFPLPANDADLVLWSYPDLLLAASVAELYRLALKHGMNNDQIEEQGAEQNWRMHATSLKMDIMSTLGFAPPAEEAAPKQSSSRNKSRK